MHYAKSAYNIIQNILYKRLVNTGRVTVIDQCSNTELVYNRHLNGIMDRKGQPLRNDPYFLNRFNLFSNQSCSALHARFKA